MQSTPLKPDDRFDLRLPTELYRLVRERAEKQRTTVANLVREHLARLVKRPDLAKIHRPGRKKEAVFLGK